MIMIAEKDGDLFDNRFQTDLMIGSPRTIVKDPNDSQDPKRYIVAKKHLSQSTRFFKQNVPFLPV